MQKYITRDWQAKVKKLRPAFTPYEVWKPRKLENSRKEKLFGIKKTTGVNVETLKEVGARLCLLPEGFTLHPTLRRILHERELHYLSGEELDWGAAEALALGSLVGEGIHVRMSGQDVERGTFSHRHAVWTDYNIAKVHIPLSHLYPGKQASFHIVNSSLSEYAVCGFEMGYSIDHPRALVVWESQFGDFANGAQVIFDRYLSSMERHWGKQVGIVINQPHGYDGMGPEHSSGRMERFLSGCNDSEDLPSKLLREARTLWNNEVNASYDVLNPLLEKWIFEHNWQVCFPSTPANYFHLLRRQIHRDFRKPLINFFSKAFLRAPNVSNYGHMRENTLFQPLIDDPLIQERKGVEEVIFCTGQIYYHLKKKREKQPQSSKNILGTNRTTVPLSLVLCRRTS